MSRRAAWSMIVMMVLAGTHVGSAPVAARGQPLRIQADLDQPVSLVRGNEPGTRLTVTVYARDGSIRVQVVRPSARAMEAAETGRLEPGMEIVARNAGRIARLRVLDIAPRSDRVTDVLTGIAPPGSQVQAIAIHVPRGGEPDREIRRTFTIGASGRWHWDTSSQLDLLGGDSLFVIVRDDDSVLFNGSAVPFMSATIGSSAVLACDLDREGPATFSLRRDGELKATATWTTGPRCHEVTLRDDAWRPRTVRAGDTLRGHFASDAVLVTEPMRLVPDASEDGAVGRCPTAGWWLATRGQEFGASGRTRRDGRFAVPRGALGDLHTGESILLRCTTPAGDDLVGAGVTVP